MAGKGKKKDDRNRTYYDSTYNREEYRVMKRYGADDLYNEVVVLRVLMHRALEKMNREGKKLTFQDHLSTLHAFSRASGRVAHLMEVQQRLFPPQAEFQQIIHEMNEKLLGAIDKDVERLQEQGQEVPEWLSDIQTKLIRAMFGGGE